MAKKKKSFDPMGKDYEEVTRGGAWREDAGAYAHRGRGAPAQARAVESASGDNERERRRHHGEHSRDWANSAACRD